MHRTTRFAAMAAAVTAVVLSAGTGSAAAADPLGTARAQAAALTATVHQLQTKTEVATEAYDGIEARLTRAVAEQSLAGQQRVALRAQVQADRAEVSLRAQALYESGGSLGVIAQLLTGNDPTDALNRYNLAGDVMSYQTRTTTSVVQQLQRATATSHHADSDSRRVTQLQVRAHTVETQVLAALSTQQADLRAATATVRQIVQADEAAAANVGAAAFSAAVLQAGGSLDAQGSMTPPNPIAAAAIAAARSRLGVPYVWGATGPNSFDCSGLTQWAYAHAGVSLPRVAAAQWNSGPHPSLADLEPGDLLFWALDTTNPSTIHHVAIYIGQGLMIAAPHTGTDVQVQPVYLDGLIGATRPWVASQPAG